MAVITRRNILGVLLCRHIDKAPCVRTANIKDVHPLQLGKLQELHTVRRDELTWTARRLTSRVRLERIVESVIQESPRPWLKGNLAVFWIGISQCVGTGAGPPPHSDVRNSKTGINRKPQAGFTFNWSEIHTSIRKVRRRTRRRNRSATAAAAAGLTCTGIQVWTLALSQCGQMERQEKHRHTQDPVLHYKSSGHLCTTYRARG